MGEKQQFRILNLGGGRGSAPIVGLHLEGEIHYDYAVFADTHDEPSWVYKQVEWLEEQTAKRGGSPIVRVSTGDLMADMREGRNSNGGKFAAIPAFTKKPDGEVSMIRRQCTREYKIEPIQKFARYELLGLVPRQKAPKTAHITQLFGFSTDEAHRAARMRKHESRLWGYEFPLLHEDLLMSKSDCHEYMRQWAPFEWMWSSCRTCPYHSDLQWVELKRNSPEDFEAACQNDEALRQDGVVINRNMECQMFIHRSCKPLRDVDFSQGGQLELFDRVCDAGCYL